MGYTGDDYPSTRISYDYELGQSGVSTGTYANHASLLLKDQKDRDDRLREERERLNKRAFRPRRPPTMAEALFISSPLLGGLIAGLGAWAIGHPTPVVVGIDVGVFAFRVFFTLCFLVCGQLYLIFLDLAHVAAQMAPSVGTAFHQTPVLGAGMWAGIAIAALLAYALAIRLARGAWNRAPRLLRRLVTLVVLLPVLAVLSVQWLPGHLERTAESWGWMKRNLPVVVPKLVR